MSIQCRVCFCYVMYNFINSPISRIWRKFVRCRRFCIWCRGTGWKKKWKLRKRFFSHDVTRLTSIFDMRHHVRFMHFKSHDIILMSQCKKSSVTMWKRCKNHFPPVFYRRWIGDHFKLWTIVLIISSCFFSLISVI